MGGHAEDLIVSHRDNDAMWMAMATIGSGAFSSEDDDSGDDGDGIDGDGWPQSLPTPPCQPPSSLRNKC